MKIDFKILSSLFIKIIILIVAFITCLLIGEFILQKTYPINNYSQIPGIYTGAPLKLEQGFYLHKNNKIIYTQYSLQDPYFKIENNYPIISFIGDSITVPRDGYAYTAVNKLNTIVSKNFKELIFASSGHNFIQEIEVIKEDVLSFNPKVVIVEFFENDINTESCLVMLPNKEKEIQILNMGENLNILHLSEDLHYYLLKKSNIYKRILNLSIISNYKGNYNNLTDMRINLFEKKVKEMKAELDNKKIPLIYLLFPKTNTSLDNVDTITEKIKVVLDKHNIPYLDIRQKLIIKNIEVDKIKKDEYGHLSENGHVIVGEIVGDFLSTFNFVN